MSSSASGCTRNSPSLAFGSTLALAKWPRIGFVTFFDLGLADAELQRRRSRPWLMVADRHDLAVRRP
jgi:hypothetical protein